MTLDLSKVGYKRLLIGPEVELDLKDVKWLNKKDLEGNNGVLRNSGEIVFVIGEQIHEQIGAYFDFLNEEIHKNLDFDEQELDVDSFEETRKSFEFVYKRISEDTRESIFDDALIEFNANDRSVHFNVEFPEKDMETINVLENLKALVEKMVGLVEQEKQRVSEIERKISNLNVDIQNLREILDQEDNCFEVRDFSAEESKLETFLQQDLKFNAQLDAAKTRLHSLFARIFFLLEDFSEYPESAKGRIRELLDLLKENYGLTNKENAELLKNEMVLEGEVKYVRKKKRKPKKQRKKKKKSGKNRRRNRRKKVGQIENKAQKFLGLINASKSEIKKDCLDRLKIFLKERGNTNLNLRLGLIQLFKEELIELFIKDIRNLLKFRDGDDLYSINGQDVKFATTKLISKRFRHRRVGDCETCVKDCESVNYSGDYHVTVEIIFNPFFQWDPVLVDLEFFAGIPRK